MKILPNSFRNILGDTIFSKATNVYRQKGLRCFIRKSFWYITDACLSSFYYSRLKTAESFLFQGKKYYYLFHPYCTTWKNERCAIIPIALDLVMNYHEKGKNILEVGNVLSHVCDIHHDIVDKYEMENNVINEDIVDYQPAKRYDLIISIVTLQHVGYSEIPRDPNKVSIVIANLKRILSADGLIVILHALGENEEMDHLLENGVLQFDERFYLKKIHKRTWKEVNWEEVKGLKYDYSIPSANGVTIATYYRNKKSNKESEFQERHLLDRQGPI